jgi:urease accessory protein
MKSNSLPIPAAVLASLALMPALAHAHPDHTAGGIANGFAHPMHGLDHILAMVAVGLWAAQLGARAKWGVPAAFASIMALGGALGMAGINLPFAEQGIAASVLILGVLIAAAVRLPLAASAGIVGVFALCHGHAHGLEMPQTAAGFAFGAGFVLATALLHASGIAAAVGLQRCAQNRWLRACGAAICAAGVVMAFN